MTEERRVKDSYKYKLMPRRTPWSDDNNSFGKLMLKKMGWKPGGGLGANLQGMKDIVPIRKKLDNKGVGYKHNDPYCVHQTSLESVLSDLNNKDDEKPDEEVTLENSRMVSLELKLLQSRARVHYQKFTLGKDISKYSSKDLEFILGKKVKKEELSSKFAFGGSSVDYFKNKLKSKSNIELSSSHNCQTVDVVKLESGERGLGFGSMQEIECVEKAEYKTREKKRLRRVLNEEVESFGNNCMVIENIDAVKKKKKYRVKENIRFEEQETSVNDDTVIIDENLKDSSIPKKNKRKDKKMLIKYSGNSEINLKQQDTSIIDYKVLIIDENIEESTISPKRKMERKITEESEIIVRIHFIENEEMADNPENNKEIKSGKKKKRKQLKSECSEDLEGTSNIVEERKKMEVEIIGEDVMISQGTSSVHLEIIEIHNKKRKKHNGNGDCQTCVQESSGDKRKNKNRHSDGHVGILVENELPSNGEIDHKKKKKRNSNVTKETLAEEFDEQNTTTIEETFANIGDVQICKRKRMTLEENHDHTSKSDHNEMKTNNSTEHINGNPERRKSVTFSDNSEETLCFNANEKVDSNEFDLDDDGGLGSEENEVVVAKGKKKKRHVNEVEATLNIKQCYKNNESKVYDKKKKKHVGEVEATEDITQFDKNNETQVYEKKKKKGVKEVELTTDVKQCDNNNETKVYDKKKKKHVREVKEIEDIKQCHKNNESQVYDMVSIERCFANRPCMDMSNFDFGFKGSNLGTIRGYGNWSYDEDDDVDDDVDADEPLHLNTNDKVAVENHSILAGDSLASEANKDIIAKKERNDTQVDVPIQEWKDWCKYDRIKYNLDPDRIAMLDYLSSTPRMDISQLDFGFPGSNIGAIRGYGNWSDTDEDENEE